MPLQPWQAQHSDPFAGTGDAFYPVTGAQPGQQTPANRRGPVHSEPHSDPAARTTNGGSTNVSIHEMELRPMSYPGSSMLTNPEHSEPLINNPLADALKPNPRQGFTGAEVTARLQITQQQVNSLAQLHPDFENRLVEGAGTPVSPVHADVTQDGAANVVNMGAAIAGRVPAVEHYPVIGGAAGTVLARSPVHSEPTDETFYDVVAPAQPTNLAIAAVRVGITNVRNITLTWNAAVAADNVRGWVILERVNNVDRPIVVPHTYPVGAPNTTPNSLLNRILIANDLNNRQVVLQRSTEGLHVFSIQSFDQNGRLSVQSATVNTRLDNTAPVWVNDTVTVTADNGVAKTVTATWNVATDAGGALLTDYVARLFNDVTDALVATSPAINPAAGRTFTSALLPAGVYYARVTATDGQGNATQTSKSVSNTATLT